MQILLDTKAVHRADDFGKLREKLVDWFRGRATVTNEWMHLFNDVCRYLHVYGVWQQFKFSAGNDDS